MSERLDKERLLRLLDDASASEDAQSNVAENALHELLSAAVLGESVPSRPGSAPDKPRPSDPVRATGGQAAESSHIAISELSRNVLLAARADLERNASRAYIRRVARALFASLLPLPLIASVAAWTLSNVHAALSQWMPGLLADYLVASYASFGVLLIAATYAAIPLLAERALTAPAPSVVRG